VFSNHEYRAFLAEAEKLLADSTNKAIRDRMELRDAVCAFFIAERKRGASLPTVLNSVEGIRKRAEMRVRTPNGHKELAQQLIDWCMEVDSVGELKVV
jgi:hypothetical protein